MRYSAKLLVLVALTALLVPALQRPGFSEENQSLREPERLEDEWGSAVREKPEKRLLLESLPIEPVSKQADHRPRQTKQANDETEPLLEVEGVLEPGDSTFTDDNSLYDTYTFEAEAGQAVIVTMESEEFDTYLLLRYGQGGKIAQNDDINDND
ncbi:MAG: PPC domain-containing protein, partial [Nodosilinea sp.]